MIQVWNRYTRQVEVEKVYGEGPMRFLYENPLGQWLTRTFLTGPRLSQAYGSLQDSKLSARKVPAFIQAYKIQMEEFEGERFDSFNQFFIRPFKKGKRTFCSEPEELSAPAEGRYLAFEKVTPELEFPVKGKFLDLRELLGSAAVAEPFIGGALYIIRLCPTDYHRYHYPDEGTTVSAKELHGLYHSVNPVALKKHPEIYMTNERRLSVLETKNFGRLAYVEVGALCVGKIVQTHAEFQSFRRGEQKGYFLFGGSTIILAAEPGRLKPDADILQKTQEKQETFIKLGDRIGTALPKTQS